MKCPQCNKLFDIPWNVHMNLESYMNSVIIVAPCCERGIRLVPHLKITAEKYTGEKTEDDWGEPLK